MSNYEDKPELVCHFQELAQCVKWLYFDYMLNVDDADVEGFKERMCGHILNILIHRIDDKYADHVEHTRKELDFIRRVFREQQGDGFQYDEKAIL